MLQKIKYKPIYRTHKDSIDRDFYVPSFSESIKLERAAGYFSLHSLTLSIDGIIRFVQKKGQIKLICSPDFSQSDAELIDTCISLDSNHITKSLLNTITDSKLSDEELDQLDVICNMLCEGKLEIKIAYQPLGIFHEKFGIFVDETGNKVYFNGSMNETKRALVHNQESFLYEHFDEISYRVEGYGILTITKPFEPFYFYNMIKIAIAVQYKVQILSSQTTKLKVKMEEIRLVNRAKMLLMQNLKMTEPEAHRYIEKEAMDRGLKKTAVAENVIKMYG